MDQSYNMEYNREEKNRFSGGNILLSWIFLTKISEHAEQQDDMSGTFEDYLEKSNMLCSQEGVDHYFLPNSQKSDFVWWNDRPFSSIHPFYWLMDPHFLLKSI